MKFLCLVYFSLMLSLVSAVAIAEPPSKESVKMYMEKIGTGGVGERMMKQMLPALKNMLPDAPSEFWLEVSSELDTTEVTNMIISVYQEHLSAEDIKEISAFYETQAGKKLLRVQPLIAKQSVFFGQMWGEKTAGKVLEKYKALPKPKVEEEPKPKVEAEATPAQ